jgi:hypothetical protein
MGSSENTRQKIIYAKGMKRNSKGNNQVYLHIRQCKQNTILATIAKRKRHCRDYNNKAQLYQFLLLSIKTVRNI